MRNTIKITLSIIIVTMIIGCGGETTKENKEVSSSTTSIENLISTGTLSGTTTSTLTNQSTDVKISKSNGNYNIEYPSLDCKGTLNIISTSITEMVFKINFTEGSCKNGTKLKLTDIGNNQISINEYEADEIEKPIQQIKKSPYLTYENFSLKDGRFTSTSDNNPNSYTILSVSNNGKKIIVDYPEAHCNAKWTSIESPSLNAIRFKETITYGNCLNNNIIEVRKSNYDKRTELSFFRNDGVTPIKAPSWYYSKQTIYYHNEQASTDVNTFLSKFLPTKIYKQYGSFTLNDGKFTSTSDNNPNSYTILHSFNNGKDIIVDYPEAHCNAKWISIESPSLNAIRFKETITYGNCVNNNIIEIRKSNYDKRVELTFFKPDGIAQVKAPSWYYSTQTIYNHNNQVSLATKELN